MIEIREQYTVARAADEVFAFVSNPARDPEWQEIVHEVRLPAPPPVHEGTRFGIAFRFMGRRMNFGVEVVAHDAPRRYSYRSTEGPFAFCGGYELTADTAPDGSAVTHVVLRLDIEPRGFFGIVPEALLVQVFKKQLSRSVARQCELLEAPEAASTGAAAHAAAHASVHTLAGATP